MEYVDPSQVSVTGYYNVLVNEFVAAGYTRGVDIRGAPYDFRKSPSALFIAQNAPSSSIFVLFTEAYVYASAIYGVIYFVPCPCALT